MNSFPKLLLLVFCILVTGIHDAFATHRSFPNITAESPSKKFKVDAVSPDNTGGENPLVFFQESFVYTFRNVEKNEILWTRKQPMEVETGTNSKGAAETYTFSKEGSPAALYVSDHGWTIIRTGWGGRSSGDDLIVVDIAGKDRGNASLLKDGLSEKEKKEYTAMTTAGRRWAGGSLWYFLDVGEQPLFIITPWWGRRIVLDLNSAKLISETPDIAKQAALCEKNLILVALQKLQKEEGVSIKFDSPEYDRLIIAAYVAGRDKIMEAIPLLEKLQNSTSGDSMNIGTFGKTSRNKDSLGIWHAFTLRQIAQLSLRRLGITPKALSATQIHEEHKDYRLDHPYAAVRSDSPRAANSGKIEPGMMPEKVINLIGEPDFVSIGDPDESLAGAWQYDMDAPDPFTLIVRWNEDGRVASVERKTPPIWQGQARDREFFLFYSSFNPALRW